ncbi:hypothetical protein PMAYCL1PPCAC_01470, partial [Pristionchus mayeri]
LALIAISFSVVDTPEVYAFNQDHVVVVNEEKCCSIRMLVGYTGNVPAVDLNNMDDRSQRQIQEVAEMYKTGDILERARHIE